MKASSYDISRLLDRDGVIRSREHPEIATALAHLTRIGKLTAVLPGVLAPAEVADEFETRILALNRYDPNAILTGLAAARLGYWKGVKVSVVTAVCAHARTDRRGFRFSTRGVPDEFVIRRRGIRLMSPALVAW